MHIQLLKPALLALAALPLTAVASPIGSDNGVAGQGLNTMAAWKTAQRSHTLVGETAIPLRTEEHTLWHLWQQGKVQALPVLAWGDGAVIYPLGQMVPILQTSPGNFSLIILNKGAVPNGMQGAPGTQWIVKTSVAGHHAIVAISPRFAGQSGNLQILATGPHGHLLTYTVGLVSDKSRYTPKLSFYRNHAAGIPLLPTSPSQQTVVGGTPPTLRATTAAPKVVASHLHVDWMMQCVTGQCGDLMPKTVASTGLQTFVHFRTPLKMPPMVLPENPQGHSWYAPSSLVGGARTLVVNASPYRLDLLQPLPKHGITEVRLTQGDHPEGSE